MNPADPVTLWGDTIPGGLLTDDIPVLEPYFPNGPGPFPAMVICPGGRYAYRSEHEATPIARWLCSLGIAAFVVQYRVTPHRAPAALMDAHRAIRLIRHHAGHWQIDANRVGILGFSAGGHLAGSAALIFDAYDTDTTDPVNRQSPRPDLAVLCYPVVTMETHTHSGSRDNLLGEEPSDTLKRQWSLEHRVTVDTPPMFIWHTVADPGVPVQNSLLLVGALQECGIGYDLHLFEKGRHGLNLAAEQPGADHWPSLCAAWLAGHEFHSLAARGR